MTAPRPVIPPTAAGECEEAEIPLGLCQCGCGTPTNISARNHAARGYVKGRPRRYVGSHGGRAVRAAPEPERFANAYTVDEAGCWLWTGRPNTSGYGTFGVLRAGAWRTEYAHRWSYEHHVGPIPEGAQVDHLCRVRMCVNPDHLEAVTPAENIRRSESPNIQIARSGACAKGHERTPENTYIRPDGKGRFCRVCLSERRAAS